MPEMSIFSGLSEKNVEKIMKCLGMKKEKCNTTETILSYDGNIQWVGILISGTAELVSYDYEGNRMLLERYEKNAIFGELFSPGSGLDSLSVIASSPCEVLFFPYQNLTAPCDHVCELHPVFLENMIHLLTARLCAQSCHIEVLSKRSLRGKLLAYFKQQAKENHSNLFTLPFSLYTLADYLSIDRSAMQREMKKMKEEGVIRSKGKKIELLE